jgi:hypothetical protein
VLFCPKTHTQPTSSDSDSLLVHLQRQLFTLPSWERETVALLVKQMCRYQRLDLLKEILRASTGTCRNLLNDCRASFEALDELLCAMEAES